MAWSDSWGDYVERAEESLGEGRPEVAQVYAILALVEMLHERLISND